MSPNNKGDKKRKRSPSPPKSPPRSASPKKSRSSPNGPAGLTNTLLSFFTPSKGKTPNGKKKRISFGAPVIHQFDIESPTRRRCPVADDAFIDARNLDAESLKVELRCRKEEFPELEIGDVDKQTHMALAKRVNALWKKDQLKQLQDEDLLCPEDKKKDREELAYKITVYQGLERKAKLLVTGEHQALTSQMQSMDLVKELEKRKINAGGDRGTLERRLEEAWLKEGSRFDVQGEDGYAFGRHSLTASDIIEEFTDKELREQLITIWNVKKADIPRKKADRKALLERMATEELRHRHELAFDIVLNDMLESYQLQPSGPKRERFDKLASYLQQNKNQPLSPY